MKYPSWKDFESKYPDYQEIAFEALARMLFRCRYELGDSLPYFKNHAGNETETIVVDGEEIGFQAKYFDNEINASLIEHSIKTAHNNHPSQSKMIVYTNLEFGNPRKRGETKTEKQKNIEQVAKDCNIQLEWMYGDNILDAVLKNELAAVLDELKRIKAGGTVSDELLETINLIANIMEGMKVETE